MNVAAKCDWCGEEYVKINGRQHYCSEKCRYEARKDYNQKNLIKHTAECKYCGKEFKLGTNKHERYCSDECRKSSEKERRFTYRDNVKTKMKSAPKVLSAEAVLPPPITEKRSKEVWDRHLEMAFDEEARRALNVDTRHWEYFKTTKADEVEAWKKNNKKEFFKKNKRYYSSAGSYFEW